MLKEPETVPPATDRKTKDRHGWRATKEGLGAQGHVPPAGLTAATATPARALRACWCLLDTVACAQVHAQAGGSGLTRPRTSSLPVALAAQKNDPQIARLFPLPPYTSSLRSSLLIERLWVILQNRWMT